MCVCVNECVNECVACMSRYVQVCCFGGADGCLPVTMLVDECQCGLLMFICLPLFERLVVKLGE